MESDIINMGAASDKADPQTQVPSFGGRIIQLLSADLSDRLQPFTDFIVAPSLQNIKQAKGQIEVTVFSTLDYSLRRERLPIVDGHLGLKVKQCRIRDCILRVTKVFPASPCEQLGIACNEYLVGLAEADYDSLKTFAEALRTLIAKRCQAITMAVCNQTGRTRIVSVPLVLLDEWKQANKGILGCELAEGWMNRFKARPKRHEEPAPAIQAHSQQPLPSAEPHPPPKISDTLPKLTQELIREEISSNVNELRRQSEKSQQQTQEIQRKCEQLRGGGDSIQRRFKGLLKSEQLDDASTICKCRVYNKNCEKCFLLREGNAYFFNRKTNRIISVPSALMFA